MTLAISCIAFAILSVAGFWTYLRYLDYRSDCAETADLMAMPPERRLQALHDAERECDQAHAYSQRMSRKRREHSLGFSHNPDLLECVVAEADYGRASRRLRKLQLLIYGR